MPNEVKEVTEETEVTETTETTEAVEDAEHAAEETVGDETTETSEKAEGSDLLKGLTPEVQTAVTKRIGKEVAKTRLARERVSELEAEVSDLKSKDVDGAAQVAQAIRLHPGYLTREESTLIQQANALDAEEQELLEHWDGIDNEDPAKAKTAAQVRKRYAEVRRQQQQIGAKADGIYQRAKRLQLADMEMGRKIRLQREAANRKATDKDKTETATGLRPVRTAARPVEEPAATRKDAINRKKLEEGGMTADALISAM